MACLWLQLWLQLWLHRWTLAGLLAGRKSTFDLEPNVEQREVGTWEVQALKGDESLEARLGPTDLISP